MFNAHTCTIGSVYLIIAIVRVRKANLSSSPVT
jgi:hypothetical protein